MDEQLNWKTPLMRDFLHRFYSDAEVDDLPPELIRQRFEEKDKVGYLRDNQELTAEQAEYIKAAHEFGNLYGLALMSQLEPGETANRIQAATDILNSKLDDEGWRLDCVDKEVFLYRGDRRVVIFHLD